VLRALRHIHRHLDERLDVATLARAAGMSVSSLHHGFKAVTTLSPGSTSSASASTVRAR
jgi:AraC-like DNA-binding protein